MYKLIIDGWDIRILKMKNPLPKKKLQKAEEVEPNIFLLNDTYYAYKKEDLNSIAIMFIKSWMYDTTVEQEKLKNQMQSFVNKMQEFV